MAQFVIDVSDADYERTVTALSRTGGYNPEFMSESAEEWAQRMIVLLIRNTVVNYELAQWQASQTTPQSTVLSLPAPID